MLIDLDTVNANVFKGGQQSTHTFFLMIFKVTMERVIVFEDLMVHMMAVFVVLSSS